MNLNINFIAYIISAYTGKIYFTQKTTHPRSRAKAIAAAAFRREPVGWEGQDT